MLEADDFPVLGCPLERAPYDASIMVEYDHSVYPLNIVQPCLLEHLSLQDLTSRLERKLKQLGVCPEVSSLWMRAVQERCSRALVVELVCVRIETGCRTVDTFIYTYKGSR